MINRRQFIRGLVAAPFVVRSGVLMPLHGLVMPMNDHMLTNFSIAQVQDFQRALPPVLKIELEEITPWNVAMLMGFGNGRERVS